MDAKDGQPLPGPALRAAGPLGLRGLHTCVTSAFSDVQ